MRKRNSMVFISINTYIMYLKILIIRTSLEPQRASILIALHRVHLDIFERLIMDIAALLFAFRSLPVLHSTCAALELCSRVTSSANGH